MMSRVTWPPRAVPRENSGPVHCSLKYVLTTLSGVCYAGVSHARCGGAMTPKKRVTRRQALSYLRSVSSDPDFVAGANEVLARKPLD
jgi:hypothetical protein